MVKSLKFLQCLHCSHLVAVARQPVADQPCEGVASLHLHRQGTATVALGVGGLQHSQLAVLHSVEGCQLYYRGAKIIYGRKLIKDDVSLKLEAFGLQG
jgi:hypothetical protein